MCQRVLAKLTMRRVYKIQDSPGLTEHGGDVEVLL